MHTHTSFSHDAKNGSVNGNCEAAIKLGMKYVAFTEHYDVDMIKTSKTRTFDLDGYRKAVFDAKERYEGKIEVLYGMELGDCIKEKDESLRLVTTEPFDFVIGSIHAPRREFDFLSMTYDKTDSEMIAVFEEYLEDQLNQIAWAVEDGERRFDTVAHITYPYRYYKQNGRGYLIDLKKDYFDEFSEIMKACIKNNIALECNTSGLRQQMGELLPNETLLRRYKELGGELITVGSDAHIPSDVGKDVDTACELLKEIGFRYITVYKNREPIQIKI